MAAPQSRQVQAAPPDPLATLRQTSTSSSPDDPWRYLDPQAQPPHSQYIDYNTVTDHTKQTEVNQRWEQSHSKSEEDHMKQEDTHKSSLGPPVSKARPRARAALIPTGMDIQQAFDTVNPASVESARAAALQPMGPHTEAAQPMVSDTESSQMMGSDTESSQLMGSDSDI